jgi:hypothetical protein
MAIKNRQMKINKLTLMTLIIVFLGNQFKTHAQDAKFQALIIYNFTKLLDWPDKSGNFVINVITDNELAKELSSFTSGRKAGGVQDFEIRQADENDTNCQIIVVSIAESDKLDKIIENINGKNILLITEKNGLTDDGAGISLVKKSGTWKFEYNESNIKAQGIKVSADFKELGIAK